MARRRAIVPCGNAFRQTIALCVLAFLIMLPACRPASAPEERTSPVPLAFAAGDRLLYDGWTLNAWGYTVDSTKTRRTWDIVRTAASAGGSSDAIMIREESFSLRTGITTVDSFFLRVTDNGSLLRYGFLADLVRRREKRILPPRWDTLDVPAARVWTVGVLDSAGEQKVTASVTVQEEYFKLDVDSVSSIVTARRIEMEYSLFEVALWLSSTPPCFPRLEEAPDPLEDIPYGSLLILRKVSLAPR